MSGDLRENLRESLGEIAKINCISEFCREFKGNRFSKTKELLMKVSTTVCELQKFFDDDAYWGTSLVEDEVYLIDGKEVDNYQVDADIDKKLGIAPKEETGFGGVGGMGGVPGFPSGGAF
jgi:hypothetical protein